MACAAMMLAATGVVASEFDLDKSSLLWSSTWSTSPLLGTPGFGGPTIAEVNGATLRQIVHISVGGDVLRVRFSNEFGEQPLVIGGARIALSAGGASIVPETSRPLTFSGNSSITVPPGAPVLSDPVKLRVPPLANLAISLYLPAPTPTRTFHSVGLHTTFLSPPGDMTDVIDLPTASTSLNYYFLTGVSVATNKRPEAIVTFGDSITDGVGSTPNTNAQWPSVLAARLQERGSFDDVAVINEGISGNRILRENAGPNGLRRFDRDVLRQPGVEFVVVLLGINDIGFSGFFPDQAASADDIIAGHRQFIARARELGLKIYGATLTPFGGVGPPYETPEGEAKRQAINQWIRTGGEYNAVIDFDKVLRDPANPTRFLAAFDSGDHLHPNDAGYQAMANAIDLKLFK
jgi:lysophospholipase L1-like esterase